MCGLAGMLDLRNRRPVDRFVLEAMIESIHHRGPDDLGFHSECGLGLSARRLSIIDRTGGHQPISNEDGTVWVAFNGELFDYPVLRRILLARGHQLKTRCDTEAIVHLWEDHGERLFEHLQGQFAFALWDSRKRTMILARDRVGISPLHWSLQDDWLLFGSEAKAILSSGMIAPRVDARGLDHLFTFFSQSSSRTCFAGINSLLPGHYLKVRDGKIAIQRYWDLDFPDAGEERVGNTAALVDELDVVLTRAVERRLRSDVPVVSYLSGGVDSAVIAALIRRQRGHSAPAFTVQIGRQHFDESREAQSSAECLGIQQHVIHCDLSQLAATYPELILATEAPVADTTCAAMLLQSRAVHEQGYKVSLTGEGADEAFAGYAWFKSDWLRRGFESATGMWPEVFNWALRPCLPWLPSLRTTGQVRRKFGCMPAQMDVFNLFAASRHMFYSREMWAALDGHEPMDDFEFDTARIRRWHPLNRSLYFSYKLMLAGMLLSHKGDRPAMHNSVETRPAFLDEDVISFCAGIHPKYKLSGFHDKRLLRLFAKRLLPQDVAMRRKKMFRAPMWGSFVGDDAPPYVRQLLSPESLSASQYFDVDAVQRALEEYPRLWRFSPRRAVIEMGMINVISTQIWHHTFIDPELADLPYWCPGTWRAATSQPLHEPHKNGSATASLRPSVSLEQRRLQPANPPVV